MNINFNTAECLKTSTYLTYREVNNICTGSVDAIPHGFFDYALYGGITAILAAAALLILGFALSVFRGY